MNVVNKTYITETFDNFFSNFDVTFASIWDINQFMKNELLLPKIARKTCFRIFHIK